MALAVSEFQLVLVQLAADLGIKVNRLIARIDRLDRTEALAFVTEAYPELASAYLAASGELAVQFYNEQPTVSAFQAGSIDLLPEDRLAASARWSLLQNDPVQALAGSAERAVMDQSRHTILENLDVEYGSVGAGEPGTRWARHASANACSFCRLLATRGSVYRSETSAVRVGGRGKAELTNFRADGSRKSGGQAKGVRVRGTQALGAKYHDNCHCIAVPVRPGGNYEPPAYVEKWQRDYVDAVGAARKAGKTKGEYGAIDAKAVLREMDKAARS